MLSKLTEPPPLNEPINPKRPKQRNTVAAKHTVFEHLYKPPGHRLQAMKMLAQQKNEAVRIQKCSTANSENMKEVLQQEFMNRSEVKCDRNKIRQMLECVKTDQNSKLEDKRNNLAGLLRKEQVGLEHEFTGSQVRDLDAEMRERELKLFRIRQERERNRKEIVDQKNVQKYINTCPEIRPYLRKNLLLDSKACQLAQIEEKHKKQMEQNDRETVWLEVARRNDRELYEKEERDRQKRNYLNQCMVSELNNQVQANREAREQQKLVDAEIKRQEEAEAGSIKQEEDRIRENRYKKSKQLGADLNKQRALAVQCQEMRNRNEEQFLKMFHDSTMIELNMEQDKLKKESQAEQRETKIFLEYAKQSKRARELEERERDKLIEMDRIKKENEQWNARQGYKMKRNELSKTTHTGLLQQIEDRERQRRQEASIRYKAELEDRERFCKQLDEDREKLRQRRLKNVRVANEQKCQAEFCKQRLQEDRQQEKDFVNHVEQEREKCVRIAKDYIEKNLDYLPLHPHIQLMKRN